MNLYIHKRFCEAIWNNCLDSDFLVWVFFLLVCVYFMFLKIAKNIQIKLQIFGIRFIFLYAQILLHRLPEVYF